MPYVAQNKRPVLDDSIKQLAEAIACSVKSQDGELAVAGLLNYSITRLLMQVINLRFNKVSYGAIALVTGVLINVKDEMYRRVAGPYEDLQAAKNGDVLEYAEHEERLKVSFPLNKAT
jgi:hypothetical protein